MNSKPRIIIEVRGGVVQAVYSSAPVEVEVLDHDDWTALEDSSTRHDEWLVYCGLQNELSDGNWLQVL
jgi:hypothetical protein